MITSIRIAATAAALAISAAASAGVPFDVRYESEKPGQQNTTATFSVGGVETFDKLDVVDQTSFKTTFGTGGEIIGVYRNVQINEADQYGGANGQGNYAVTFSEKGYSLDLYSSIKGGVNYFGYWLSALDQGNQVTFYSKDKLLFTFDPTDVLKAVEKNGDAKKYYGNPNEKFAGQNSGEPYIFLNFFNDAGSFDRVVFAETPARGGYESDNHTVGHFLEKGTGTSIDINPGSFPGAVPEPATWAMLAAGFGLVGVSTRRRRPTVVAA
jgi:hypothetical protein